MGWERRRGKLYYYIAKRNGNKVVKRYVGRGPAALLASLEVERQSKIRKAEAQELEDYVARLWSLDRSMSLVRQAAKEALHSAYFLAGYYQTACYHWHKSNGVEMGRKRNRQQNRRRKRQNKASNSQRSNESADANQVTPNPPDGDSQGQEAELTVDPDKWPMTINDSLRLIKSGRRDLIGHLRWQLSNVPALWQRVGDIFLLAVEGWARQIAGDDVLLRESIMLIAKEERRQLMLDNCTLMERVVIDRFVLAKLQLQYFEFMAPHTAGELAGSKLANAICKRQTSAIHQYYEAARHLAKVKELGTEISPHDPAAMSVSLKVYAPETAADKRISA